MSEIRLKYLKNFKLELTCTDPVILNSFMSYLNTDQTVMKPVFIGKRRIFKPVTTSKKLYRKKKNSLIVNIGLADYLAFHMSHLHKNYPELSLVAEKLRAQPIVLNEKWESIFRNHPKGIERGEMQVSDFKRLVRTNTGIAELFTGYGKTELLLAIAECSGERVIILAPDNHIRDEILSRAKAYGVAVGNYDWGKQINVINVMGFMRSKNLNDEAKSWLKDAKVALSDECHHSSCDSYQDFFDLLENLERSHGFSASTDVADGKKVIAGSVNLSDLGPNTASVVSFSGPVRITRTTKIPVDLVLVRTKVADRQAVSESSGWSAALDQSIACDGMASVVSKIFDLDKSRSFFIPIHKKESGDVLYYNLVERGYKGILWTADSFVVNGQAVETKDILGSIKKTTKLEHYDFVMSTKLEGIDIPNLNAVIPLVGSNYRMIVQPIGRSARGNDIIIYLIYDQNNPITISQANNRLERIVKEYNLVSRTKVILEP